MLTKKKLRFVVGLRYCTDSAVGEVFVEDQLILLDVGSPDQILNRLKKVARLEIESSQRVDSPDSRLCRFVGVTELALVYEPLRSGAEILFRRFKARSNAQISRDLLSEQEIWKYIGTVCKADV